MDNSQIADCFSLLAKLTDIHGDNSFKAKSYAAATYNIEQLQIQLSEIPKGKISALKGIGESTAKKIIELLETGELKILTELIQSTPEGVIEMMSIKGIGPKKISTIWKEMEIENIGELLYACKENRLKLYKGFGEKTQNNVIESIEFYLKNRGNFLFSQVNAIAEKIISFFQSVFPQNKIEITGAFKRQLETIDELELIMNASADEIEKKLSGTGQIEMIEQNNEALYYKLSIGLKVKITACDESAFLKTFFVNNCSKEFLDEFILQNPDLNFSDCETEHDIFKAAGIDFISPCRRENPVIIEKIKHSPLPPLLTLNDIKGVIHSHSNWSDGSHTIEEMVKNAIEKGFEYLVISDHSKSAFYAGGLSEERIAEQHRYIDELNKKYAPFEIFKSIECDILNDGNLDYSNTILSEFDLIIASIHSNLKMTEEKAMQRLIKAIENPYTTILGHMTGRLLLSRKGYPVDYKKVVDACLANQVAIELNANPNRLDIDWRHIDYALERGVLISIDPDAHSTGGFDDIQYGVFAAQKTLLDTDRNISSFNLAKFKTFIENRKPKS